MLQLVVQKWWGKIKKEEGLERVNGKDKNKLKSSVRGLSLVSLLFLSYSPFKQSKNTIFPLSSAIINLSTGLSL